jgi:hypothetical protein
MAVVENPAPIPARFVVQLLEVQKRQLGLLLGVLVVLVFGENMPCLRVQDAAKTQPRANAPQQTSQGQAKTVTCTVEISSKALSTSLAEALRLYRTGKLDDSAAAYNGIITSGGADRVLAYAGLARVYLRSATHSRLRVAGESERRFRQTSAGYGSQRNRDRQENRGQGWREENRRK